MPEQTLEQQVDQAIRLTSKVAAQLGLDDTPDSAPIRARIFENMLTSLMYPSPHTYTQEETTNAQENDR